MSDRELTSQYLPIFHFDREETIPLRAVGWTIARTGRRSASFPKREIPVAEGGLTIEYACYWDYDIQHMYDLEHVWVMLDRDGGVLRAEGSFHGKYLNLWDPEMGRIGALPPEKGRVHAFAQPGKHAFLPRGELTRLVPGWKESCRKEAGGPVLTGGPFEGRYQATAAEDERSRRYIREQLAFDPTLAFIPGGEKAALMPWEELAEQIPGWIRAECRRLRELYGGEE